MNNVVNLKDIEWNLRNTFDEINYVSTNGVFDLTTLVCVNEHIIGDLLTKEGFYVNEIMRGLKHNTVVKLTDEFAEGIIDKFPNAFNGKVLLFE